MYFAYSVSPMGRRTSLFAWRHAWLAITLGLAIGVLSDTVRAAQPPLTLGQAQRLAIKSFRQLVADDAAIQSSLEMAV